MEWFRWYHGVVFDPKFKLVARKSGQPVTAVISVWAALLECASQAECRGDISSFDCENFDIGFDLPDGACQAIVDALEGKGLIHEGRLSRWEVRQPEPERQSKSNKVRQRKKQDTGTEGGESVTNVT